MTHCLSLWLFSHRIPCWPPAARSGHRHTRASTSCFFLHRKRRRFKLWFSSSTSHLYTMLKQTNFQSFQTSADDRTSLINRRSRIASWDSSVSTKSVLEWDKNLFLQHEHFISHPQATQILDYSSMEWKYITDRYSFYDSDRVSDLISDFTLVTFLNIFMKSYFILLTPANRLHAVN